MFDADYARERERKAADEAEVAGSQLYFGLGWVPGIIGTVVLVANGLDVWVLFLAIGGIFFAALVLPFIVAFSNRRRPKKLALPTVDFDGGSDVLDFAAGVIWIAIALGLVLAPIAIATSYFFGWPWS